MDVVVDHFFDLTEFYDDQISHIHDCILDFPKLDYTKTLHLMHKEPTEKLLTALKDTSSTTEFISNLLALEQTTTALMDLTFNMISHQTNENMKLLSVVSFVFLPITFVAGVFGMNFEVFPEIHFKMVISIAWSWRLGLFRRN
ncbi:cora-domain-containing protein [Rhizoclosmatium globosum]|uniref:Cora-domain-containing protein n=1 Tax=Rhizoclosmatium globosum TaxID=329046 RepID=A0A1Y2CII3_9FUNG|nr:cora-domain-containing protein [Rhizoclosmatium globosum]|eukprot:ORY46839.1 cora-domain-containing protein [Rhizoclosmatium globosum]